MNIEKTVSSSLSSNSTAEKKRNELGEEDFLNLLVTQLRYQDPLNPLDNKEFIAQTAQFTSLETLQKINENIQSSNKSFSSAGDMFATAMIGKNVLANVKEVSLKDGSTSAFDFEVPKDTEGLVSFYDTSGNLVRRDRISGAGKHSYTWDGHGDSGDTLPDGTYSLEVSSLASNGESSALSPTISGVVSGVRLGGGKVLVGSLEIPISNVLEVRNN